MEKFSVVRSAGLMDLSVKQSGETFWDFPRALQGEGGEGAQARGEGGPEGPLTVGEKNLFVLLMITER